MAINESILIRIRMKAKTIQRTQTIVLRKRKSFAYVFIAMQSIILASSNLFRQ